MLKRKCYRYDYIYYFLTKDLMMNNFGNYVVQKALKVSSKNDKILLIQNIYKNIDKIRDRKLNQKWKSIIESNLEETFDFNEERLSEKKSKTVKNPEVPKFVGQYYNRGVTLQIQDCNYNNNIHFNTNSNFYTPTNISRQNYLQHNNLAPQMNYNTARNRDNKYFGTTKVNKSDFQKNFYGNDFR